MNARVVGSRRVGATLGDGWVDACPCGVRGAADSAPTPAPGVGALLAAGAVSVVPSVSCIALLHASVELALVVVVVRPGAAGAG
jgi:hypothetical protein